MHAIILDGNLKSALAAVRSLSKHGISVSVGAERPTGMALHSRYATSRFVYPSPYTEREACVRAIKAEAVRLGGKPVVYAFSDATYLMLYQAREDLSEYMALVFPSDRSVGIAFDKAATYSLARVSGVPTIMTYAPETETEVERLAHTLRYPAVVKTRRSVSYHEGKGIFGSAIFVHTPEELVHTFMERKARCGELPIVQDLVVGEEYGVEMMALDGHAHAVVVHHRLRSLSPTGGASVLKETVSDSILKSTMLTYAEKLVYTLGWSGPIMVEFKVDADSREPLLMEINGRFWGSLPLSIAAGVDMPYLYYLLARGEALPQGLWTARDHVITRHFLGDCMHILRVFFDRNLMRKSHYPRRWQACKDFCSVPRGTMSDVWSFGDMLPTFYEIIDMLKKRL